MKDVAELAGVSVATVSYALNDPDRVASATLERVKGAIEHLGFRRNRNARSLAHGDPRLVGFVMIELRNSLFVDIATGAQAAASDAGLRLQLASSDNDTAQQDEHTDFFDEMRATGILIAPMTDPRQTVERMRRHRRPIVVLNYDMRDVDTCTVLVDNERVGYLAARHLIDLGRTRLAYVAGRDHLQPVSLRRAGIRRAVDEEAGRVTLEEISTEAVGERDGAIAGEHLLERAPKDRPDGVIAVTDLIAVALTSVLGTAGVSVPDEIAVMGCDYNSTAWSGSVPLTSVALHGEEMGRAAIRLLLDEARNGPRHVHTTVMVQPELIPRASTVGIAGETSARRSAPS